MRWFDWLDSLFPQGLIGSRLESTWGIRIVWGLICAFSLLILNEIIAMHGLFSERQATDPVPFSRPFITMPLPDMSKWHILGVYEPRDVDALSPTALNLTLVGVMSSPSQASAKAIIANANGKQELYGVNDEPLAGVKIYKVLTDSVILEHDGQFEVLTLPKQPLIFSGPNRSLFG